LTTPMTSGRALAKSRASKPPPGAVAGAETARCAVFVAAVLAIRSVLSSMGFAPPWRALGGEIGRKFAAVQ
jgi:hypothetical protein